MEPRVVRWPLWKSMMYLTPAFLAEDRKFENSVSFMM